MAVIRNPDELSLAMEDRMATERNEQRGSAETAQPDAMSPYRAIIDAVQSTLDVQEIADAVAEAVRAQIGMIPTAQEIAREIREYDAGRAVPAEADRTEGHPVDPEDGLS